MMAREAERQRHEAGLHSELVGLLRGACMSGFTSPRAPASSISELRGEHAISQRIVARRYASRPGASDVERPSHYAVYVDVDGPISAMQRLFVCFCHA